MQNNNNSNEKTLDSAREFIKRGWMPVPVPFKSKSPVLKDWQNLDLTELEFSKHFNGKPQNIGIMLGEKSGNLVDIDLDSSEAIKLAKWFLPDTDAIFGRKSKPSSHWLYYCADVEYRKFNNPLLLADKSKSKNACIVEIRANTKSKGIQTIFPPSVHPSGEIIGWYSDGEPTKIYANDLTRRVEKLAAASLLARYWNNGVRHELTMAVSGALLRHDFSLDEVKHFIRAICYAASDDELTDRLQVVQDTATNLSTQSRTFGLPKLAELTDQKFVKAFCEWLRIDKKEKVYQESGEQKNNSVSKKFNFTTLDDLLNEPEENHSYVWENTLIFGGISICSAKPKVGKSTLARNLAVSISRGAKFLGRATAKGKIIYLCLEEKRAEIAKHFKRMGASGKDILIHTGKTPNDTLQALKLATAEIEPFLIIVDPMSRILRVTDFNDYATMARGLEPFIDLARDFNVHILMLHHDGKGGREGNDSILGSTAIFGAVDCHLNLKKRDNGRTVWSTQRYGVDLPETVIELDVETGLIVGKGDLQFYLLEETKKKILDSISETDIISETEIKERVGANSKGIISKAIRSLLEDQRLSRSGEGKRNCPFLYSKQPQITEEIDYSAKGKSTKYIGKNTVLTENRNSRFVGFSNNENLENLETQTKDFYVCPNCDSRIPIMDDVCNSCGKTAIEF